MPLTLDELREIKSALEWGRFVESYFDECEKSIKLINREIKLKETDFIRMVDAQGNPIDNDGN